MRYTVNNEPITIPDELDALPWMRGRHTGKPCLIIAGGPSGNEWHGMPNMLRVGINATIGKMNDHLDYWLAMDKGSAKCPWWYLVGTRPAPRACFVWWRMYRALPPEAKNCYQWIARGFKEGVDPREADALWGGYPMVHTPGKHPSSTGGSLMRAMHLMAIAGCSEIHTIGVDLCYHDLDKLHWYDNSIAGPQPLWNKMRCKYLGLTTNWFFVDTAHFLLDFWEPALQKIGVRWIDHSQGLLQRLGKRDV